MDKYIFIKRKVLTKDSCDHLIEMFEKSELCDNIRGYKFMDANLQTLKFSFLRELLLSACAEYFKKHPFLSKRRMYIRNIKPLYIGEDLLRERSSEGSWVLI